LKYLGLNSLTPLNCHRLYMN